MCTAKRQVCGVYFRIKNLFLCLSSVAFYLFAASYATFSFESKASTYPDSYAIKLSGSDYICHAGGTADLTVASYSKDCTFLAVHPDLDHNRDQKSCVDYCKKEEEKKPKEMPESSEDVRFRFCLYVGDKSFLLLQGMTFNVVLLLVICTRRAYIHQNPAARY